jgi:type IV pilus assembly protein PilM
MRRREGLRRRRPWLVAAAVLGASSLLPPILHYRHAAAVAREELAAVKKIVTPLRAREARNRVRREEIAALTRETARLGALAARRTGWIRLLADLQEHLTAVEDVWLESLRPIAPAGDAPLKLAVAGRMLDRTNPLAKASPETEQRVAALLAEVARSPFVSAVEGGRFDNSRPGILKFDFVLVTNPARPL